MTLTVLVAITVGLLLLTTVALLLELRRERREFDEDRERLTRTIETTGRKGAL
jgi:hypothetical protein